MRKIYKALSYVDYPYDGVFLYFYEKIFKKCLTLHEYSVIVHI